MNNLLSETDTRAVADILIEQLGVQENQLTPDARLREDLGSDSLDDVEIVMKLEEHFHVAVPDEATEQVSTVGDLFEMLADVLAERDGGIAQRFRRPDEARA